MTLPPHRSVCHPLLSAVGWSCARLQAALSMVSPTMKAVVDAVWAVWSIGASIYDYIHTNAMEERIHALENVITIHQCVIGLLSAGVLTLFTYILLKKLWGGVKGPAGADVWEVEWPESDPDIECGKTNTDQTDKGEIYTLGT